MSGTTTIKDVEILRVGTWNGVPFTLADLESIVDAYNETADVVPPRVQLGHDEKQRLAGLLFADTAGADGFPALGWPERLRVKGQTLLADLAGVPLRLAKLVENRRYRARSGGLLRNYKVGAKVYAWVLDHVALLGDQAPAVPGLADMGLSSDGSVFTFSIEGADGLDLATAGDGRADPEEETELDRIMASFEALAEQWGALVYGRRGAPAARTLWAEFAGRLRSVARKNMEEDGTMSDKVSLTDHTGGMAFDSADQLAGWLSGALGVPPGDFGAIAAAVAKAIGTAVPDEAVEPADPAAAPAAPTGGDEAMSRTTDSAVALAAQRITDLDTRLAETQARLAAAELRAARTAAEARVDGDMAARALPAGLRDTLVELAMRPDLAPYQSVVENAKSVPTGERGHAGEGLDLAAVTLTATDRSLARQLGISEADFLSQKQADAAPRG